MEIINATDGYKLGHHRMYPEGTQMVYSNWTPRSCRYFPEGSVVFGIQYFVKKYLIEELYDLGYLPIEIKALSEGKYYCDFNPFMDDDESHYVEVSEGQYYEAPIQSASLLR